MSEAEGKLEQEMLDAERREITAVPADPSPTPWDHSTWGFYCDTCKKFFNLVRDGKVILHDGGYSSYQHSCGNPARYIGYDHNVTEQLERDKTLSAEKFWGKWHEATYGKRVDQYMSFWGWRNVALAAMEAYASYRLAAQEKRITILCPKGHLERRKDCKHCAVLTALESESRDGLAKLILTWHDAFYREENRANAEVRTLEGQLAECRRECNRIRLQYVHERDEREKLKTKIDGGNMENPYQVELNRGGCSHCENGKLWDVVGPNEAALAISYSDIEDAEYIADILNHAYALGLANAPKSVEEVK
jgi:hypothetical protein